MRSNGTPLLTQERTREERARMRSVGWSTLHRSLQPRERATQPGSDGGHSGHRGEGARGARHALANAAKTAEQTRGPQARRGEAKVLETAAEPKRDEQGRAQVLRSRNCAAPSGIPIQFQSRHTQAQAPAGIREPCPKHAACPERAQERGRVQGGRCRSWLALVRSSIFPRPRCAVGGDRETSAANCRCPV